MPPETEPLLAAEALRKVYTVRGVRVRALDGIDLEVVAGETLAVVGESGSGKTTLGRLILGVEEPSGGRLFFRGQSLPANRTGKLRKALQLVQQDPYTTLNPRRTTAQTIMLPLRVHRMAEPRRLRSRAAELLETVGLSPENLDRYPSALSGGQRQRVAIARALACSPELVVLDEPTSALDVSVQAKVLALLADLQTRFGLTYVFITHDLGVVRNVAGRIAVMYQGRIVESGVTAEVFAAPRHPYTEMLLSAVPVVSAEEQRVKPTWAWDRLGFDEAGRRIEACLFAPRCPFADEPCRTVQPPLEPVNEGHLAACHLNTGVVTIRETVR